VPRTPKLCGYPGSPKCLNTATHKGRCEAHKIAPFEGARDRWKSHRPKNYEATRRFVIRRAEGRCESCGAPGAEVDKIKPDAEGGLWIPENLQYLCKSCHRTKTDEDARRGRQRLR
jgi:5-methylcytosine-specific restriction enzyme A